MKTLILLLFLVHGCHLSYAENWMPISEIKAGTAKTVYTQKADCEKLGECVEVSNKDLDTQKVVVQEVDDLSKPTYSTKSEVEACDGDVDCYQKLKDKTCSDGEKFIDESFKEVYCAKQTGYEKVSKDVLVLDAALVEQKAQKVAKLNLLQGYYEAGEKDAKFGQYMTRVITGYLKGKKLDKASAKALIEGFGPVITYFGIGRIDLAKEAIEAYQPDGVAFTQESKTLFLEVMTENGY